MKIMAKRLRDEMDQHSSLEWLRIIEFHDRSMLTFTVGVDITLGSVSVKL